MIQSIYTLWEYINPWFSMLSSFYLLYNLLVNRARLKKYRQTILDSNNRQSEKLDVLLEEIRKNRKINL